MKTVTLFWVQTDTRLVQHHKLRRCNKTPCNSNAAHHATRKGPQSIFRQVFETNTGECLPNLVRKLMSAHSLEPSSVTNVTFYGHESGNCKTLRQPPSSGPVNLRTFERPNCATVAGDVAGPRPFNTGQDATQSRLACAIAAQQHCGAMIEVQRHRIERTNSTIVAGDGLQSE